jgi:hypothetical protein
MNNNIKTEITEYGKKSLDEITEKTFAWMDGENTVGDFFTTLFDELVEEWLGEDILSMSIAKLKNDKDSQIMFLKRICESPLVDVFKKVENPEELL